jgi:hypothetical protein
VYNFNANKKGGFKMLVISRYLNINRTESGLLLEVSPNTTIPIEEDVINTGMDIVKIPFKGTFRKHSIIKGDDLLIPFSVKMRLPFMEFPKLHLYNKDRRKIEPIFLNHYYEGRGRGRKYCNDFIAVVDSLPLIIEDIDGGCLYIIEEEDILQFYISMAGAELLIKTLIQ